MNLILITDKHRQLKAGSCWSLELENMNDLMEYMKHINSKDTKGLWDFMGDRDMKEKGNNPIGHLLTNHLHTVPAGESVHFGQLCFEVDRFKTIKHRNMMKVLERGESIRVSAAGGYCATSQFTVLNRIEISTEVMNLYINDFSEKLENFINYLLSKKFNIVGQEVKINKIHKMYYSYPAAAPSYRKFIIICDNNAKNDVVLNVLSDKINHISQTYFGLGKRFILTQNQKQQS